MTRIFPMHKYEVSSNAYLLEILEIILHNIFEHESQRLLEISRHFDRSYGLSVFIQAGRSMTFKERYHLVNYFWC